MLEETTNPGLIPDFFHDVIAFFIPGYFLLILVWVNNLLILENPDMPIEISIGTFFFISIAAYVIGRILGQLGFLLLHHREFPNLFKTIPGPKWALLFDEKKHKLL